MAVLTIRSGDALRAVAAPEGTLLSDALLLHGAAPDTPCGGMGRCGKCRVTARGALSPLTAEERAALSGAEIDAGLRLACRTRILGDAEAAVSGGTAPGQICADGRERDVPFDPMFTRLGAAVDLGTTTLAARLYDRAGLLATAAAPNPQAAYGADVLTRVGRSMDGDGPAMTACVRAAIAGLLRGLCGRAGRKAEEIDGLVITGNTAMLHLLTGTDPSPLAAAPFAVRERFGRTIPATALELPCAADAVVYLPRCISAFVGADITTALMACDLCRSGETALLVDVGTNGEMALWHNGLLRCCSTAAGPAFEGAGLSQGMGGASGAIDHAWIRDGRLELHTIDDAPAAGICGSGVIDVIACLLELGELDETGLLADGERNVRQLTETVAITQQDVRQVQLAKSAIRAGVESLLYCGGVQTADISRFAIAGGFGSYLSLERAAGIGLFPAELVPRGEVWGNAALTGASALLRSRGLWAESSALADAAVTLELSTDPFFRERYVEAMLF